MTTYTATRAAATFPVTKPAAGSAGVAWGVIEVTANPAQNDVFQMCRVPKGAVITGGWIRSDDLDTNGTETLDLDVGYAANGVDSADPDAFGNLGVMGTDTVAGIKPEAGYNYPFGGVLATDGPLTLNAETIITVTCNAAAATFAAGTLSVVVQYYVP
jgi:hypothetical protein